MYLIPALFLLAQTRLHVFLCRLASIGVAQTTHDTSLRLANPKHELLQYTLPLLFSISTGRRYTSLAQTKHLLFGFRLYSPTQPVYLLLWARLIVEYTYGVGINGIIFLIAFSLMVMLIAWAIIGVFTELKKTEDNPGYTSPVVSALSAGAAITQPGPSKKKSYVTGLTLFIIGVLLWWVNDSIGPHNGYLSLTPPMVCGFGLLLLYRTYRRSMSK